MKVTYRICQPPGRPVAMETGVIPPLHDAFFPFDGNITAQEHPSPDSDELDAGSPLLIT